MCRCMHTVAHESGMKAVGSLCVCVCVCACVCVCVCKCLCVHACNVCMSACARAHVPVRVCACVRACWAELKWGGQEHPEMPVVENMEDLWKVAKLQRERKARLAMADLQGASHSDNPHGTGSQDSV